MSYVVYGPTSDGAAIRRQLIRDGILCPSVGLLCPRLSTVLLREDGTPWPVCRLLGSQEERDAVARAAFAWGPRREPDEREQAQRLAAHEQRRS
jgi:hypothetical protein